MCVGSRELSAHWPALVGYQRMSRNEPSPTSAFQAPPPRRPRLVVTLSLLVVVLGLGVLTLAMVWSRASATILSPASESRLPKERGTQDIPVSREDHTLSPKLTVLPQPPVQQEKPAPATMPGEREFQKGTTETICTEDGCVGPRYARKRTQELLDRNPARYSPEEIEILKKYTVDGLGRAVIDAESRLLKSDDQTRDRETAAYQLVLNLAASLAPPPPPIPDEERRAYEQYAIALRRAEPFLAKLNPKAAEQERSRIKEQIFAALRPQQ